MTKSVDYYDSNAKTFFDATVAVDMTPLHERFLSLLPPNGRVLDAGCGSGRDAKEFAERGFRVDAFDASPELAKLASDYTGLSVEVMSFLEFDRHNFYDGIWACASVLHVAEGLVETALKRLWRGLKPTGVLYLSFKDGVGEREQGGRVFTDATSAQLTSWMQNMDSLVSTDIWQSTDQRPDRQETWVNGIFRKAPLCKAN